MAWLETLTILGFEFDLFTLLRMIENSCFWRWEIGFLLQFASRHHHPSRKQVFSLQTPPLTHRTWSFLNMLLHVPFFLQFLYLKVYVFPIVWSCLYVMVTFSGHLGTLKSARGFPQAPQAPQAPQLSRCLHGGRGDHHHEAMVIQSVMDDVMLWLSVIISVINI